VVLGGGVPSVGLQEELRGLSIYFQGFFEPTTVGDVKIFGFYTTKKQTGKQNKRIEGSNTVSWVLGF